MGAIVYKVRIQRRQRYVKRKYGDEITSHCTCGAFVKGRPALDAHVQEHIAQKDGHHFLSLKQWLATKNQSK